VRRTLLGILSRSMPILQRIGWVGSRLVSLGVPLQDSRSTLLKADVQFFLSRALKLCRKPCHLITYAAARQYGMRTRTEIKTFLRSSSAVISPVLSSLRCCYFSSPVISPAFSSLQHCLCVDFIKYPVFLNLESHYPSTRIVQGRDFVNF